MSISLTISNNELIEFYNLLHGELFGVVAKFYRDRLNVTLEYITDIDTLLDDNISLRGYYYDHPSREHIFSYTVIIDKDMTISMYIT